MRGDQNRRMEEATATGGREGRRGWKRLQRRSRPGRSRQELDSLPGVREAAEEAAGDRSGGGEGAGQRLRPGEEGGGRREGGCPTANTHTELGV